MRIVKGSSFATWTKKLQGKSTGQSKDTSHDNPRNVVSPIGSPVVIPTVSRALDIAEERGETERSDHVADWRDQRDDPPVTDDSKRDDQVDETFDQFIRERFSQSVEQSQQGISDEAPLDPESYPDPEIVPPDPDGTSDSDVAPDPEDPPDLSAPDNTDDNGKREKEDGDNVATVFSEESFRLADPTIAMSEAGSFERVEAEISETLTRESDHPKNQDATEVLLEPNPHLIVKDPPATDQANQKDATLLSRYTSTSASSVLESSTESVLNPSLSDESTSVGSWLEDSTALARSTKDKSDMKERSDVFNNEDLATEEPQLTGKDASPVNKATDTKNQEDFGETQYAGNDEPVGNDNEKTGYSQPGQGQQESIDSDGIGIVHTERNDTVPGSEACQADVDRGVADSGMGTSQEEPIAEKASAGPPNGTSEERLGRGFVHPSSINEDEKHNESELPDGTTTSKNQSDKLPSSHSKANIDSKEYNQETTRNEDVFPGTEEVSFDNQDVETNDAKTTSRSPTRRFSKSNMASWAGLKRLAKTDKNTGGQEFDPGTKSSSAKQHAHTKEESTASSFKNTMKNRMRQEKRALGRVKQKSKKPKNSLVGVGEIISAAASSASPVLPLSSSSSFSNRVPVSPKSSEVKTLSQSPDRRMSDMIWWSNENEEQCVEIIAVKSDGVAKAWDQEQGAKEHEKQTEETEADGDAENCDNLSGIIQYESDEHQRSLDDTMKLRSSKSKGKSRSKKGSDRTKTKSTDMNEERSTTSKVRRRERLRDKRKRKRLSRSRRALASMSSDLSDVNEQCACNEDVIQDSRVLCGDGEAEEAGCRDIRYDLREMAIELLRKGPAVMVAWLE